MKYLIYLLAFMLTLSSPSCKSSAKTSAEEVTLEERLDEKNRASVSLLNRIQKLPGISLRNQVPIFARGNNSFEASGEPLYILDDYIVGKSFRSVNELVESVNVKKVEALSASEASLYGSRAASGVIKITTYKE